MPTRIHFIRRDALAPLEAQIKLTELDAAQENKRKLSSISEMNTPRVVANYIHK